MAEQVTQVKVVLKGVDELSPVVDKAVARTGAQLDKASRRQARSGGGADQAARDIAAARLRGDRNRVRREPVTRQADAIVAERQQRRLSRTAAAGGTDTGMMYGPSVGGFRTAQRSIAEQAMRDQLAASIRETRAGVRGRASGGGGGGGGGVVAGGGGGGVFASRRVGGGGGEGPGGLAGLRRDAGNVSSLLRGGGALAVADIAGRSLTQMAGGITTLNKKLEEGEGFVGSLAEAAADGLPGIGTLARGIRSLADSAAQGARSFFDTITGVGATRRDRADRETQRKEVISRRDAMRSAIMGSSEDAAKAAREATAEGELAKMPGYRGAEARAAAERDRELAAVNADNNQAGRLSPEQRAKFEENQRVRRAAVEAKYNAATEAADKEDSERRLQAERENADEITRLRQDTRQTQLRDQGRVFEAEMEIVRDATRQRREEIQRGIDDEVATYGAGSAEVLEAKRRAAGQLAALEESEAEKTRSILKRRLDEEKRLREEHESSIVSTGTQAASRRLETAGRTQEAEKLQLKEGLRRRLEEIDRARQDEIKQGGNATDVNRRAQESAAAAKDLFDAESEAMAGRRGGFDINRGNIASGGRLGARLTTSEVQTSLRSAPDDKAAKAIEKATTKFERKFDDLSRKFGDEMRAALAAVIAPTA